MTRTLGKIAVAAAGTPVRLTSELEDPTQRVGAQAILVQALPGNTGLIYFQQGSAEDRTTLNTVIAILPAPLDPDNGPFPSFTLALPVIAAGLNVADYYIDASSSTDGVLVTIIGN